MRLPRNLFILALALTIVWVCSAQDNQNPIPRNEFEKKDSGTTIKPLETESSERSTEQSTSTPNMELGRLARQANGLSADQANRLEESLIRDPNDLAARAQLLGYYFAASPRLNPETVHEARVRHILWLVQKEPESELAGMSEATIDPVGDSLADPAGYEKVKALWLEQVKSHPDKVMVLVNAAWFFKLPDKAIAADLLTRAHAIDPGNQNASAGLGIVYAAAIVGLTGMNQNRFPTETKPEEAGSPFAQKAREELNKSQDAQVIGTAGYYLNFWGSILSAQGKTLTDYEDLAEKCLTKAQTLDPGNPEWARDLASLYKLRAMKAKSPEARAKPPATTPQAKSSSEQDTTSNVRSLATEFLKYPAVGSCSKKDCTIIVTNFVLPDGNTSPYGMQLADELSKELASQNHKIQVIDRGLLQDFLAKDLVPAKSVNAGLVRSIAFALKARFVVLGTTKRTDENVVQLSTRLFDVADKNGSGYSAVVNLLAPKSSVDFSPSKPFASLPPITSTASGESIYFAGVDGVSMPKCTYMPNPSSEEATKFQLSGAILVDTVINSEGKVENVRIVRGLPDGLNDRTIATLKTWRCNPALKDGKAVPTRVQMEVHFNFRPNSSGYEVFDSRKELEAKGEHGNSMAKMSLPQDVTWTDPGTGLMWTKEDNGSRINWNEANQYCRDMKVKDYSDWRLPTIEELSGIFDKTQNVGGYHIKGGIHLSLCCEWSSSTGLDSNQRWLLHFMGGGRVSGRLDYTFPVLCVRNAAK